MTTMIKVHNPISTYQKATAKELGRLNERKLYDAARARRETPSDLDQWFMATWREHAAHCDLEKFNWPYEFYIPRLRNAFHRYIVDIECQDEAYDFYRERGYFVAIIEPMNEESVKQAVRKVQYWRGLRG